MLTAAATLRMLGTAAAADFDVCQDPITPEPHEVRSLQAAEPRPLPLVNQPKQCS